jgi:hypothetical protein
MTLRALTYWPQMMGGLARAVNTWESRLPVTNLSSGKRMASIEKQHASLIRSNQREYL